MYTYRTSFLIRTEVGVTQHAHYRCMIEEADGIFRQLGNVNQRFGIGMTVNQRICQEVCAFLGVQNMHGAEMFVFWTDADDFLGDLDGIAVFGVKACDESVCFTRLHHHHTKVVTFEHFVVGFFVSDAFAGTFFR